MDNNPQSAKPISDDQELAKVLAGVNQQADEALQFETTPVVTTTTSLPPLALAVDPVDPVEDQSAQDASAMPTPTLPSISPAQDDEPASVDYTPPMAIATPAPVAMIQPTMNSADLSDIKKDALNDLRPLVDKLDIAADEKFDTYLLLIRSTDDKTLIAPAYAAAQAITDEARRAQALLDVIKEIDYLSNPAQ